MNRLGEPPYVCLVTPGRTTSANFLAERSSLLDTIRSACNDGVNMVQIREKQLPARMLFELVLDAVEITSKSGALLLVNDRADVAIAARAGGVHLTENSIPVAALRARFGEHIIVGVSTHSSEDAANQLSAGADYVFWGPVFETPGKGPPRGVDALRETVAAAGGPVVAIGGIDAGNVEEVLSSGVAGVAAIRTLSDTTARREFLGRVRAGWQGKMVL